MITEVNTEFKHLYYKPLPALMFSLYKTGAKMFSYWQPLRQEVRSSSVSKSSRGELNKNGGSVVKEAERRCPQFL